MDEVPRHIGAIAGGLGRHLSDFSQDIARKLRQTSQRLTQPVLSGSDNDGNANQLHATGESRHSTSKKARAVTPLESIPGIDDGKSDPGRKAAARTASRISSNGGDLAERQKLPRIKTKPQVERSKAVSDDGQRRHRSGVRGVEVVTRHTEDEEDLEALPPPPRLADKDEEAGSWGHLHPGSRPFPPRPTKQQQRDVHDLMNLMTRIYPCKECADHFKEVMRTHPPVTKSGPELAQWMCTIHNVVNRSLNKPQFPCKQVDTRWGALECAESACAMEGRR